MLHVRLLRRLLRLFEGRKVNLMTRLVISHQSDCLLVWGVRHILGLHHQVLLGFSQAACWVIEILLVEVLRSAKLLKLTGQLMLIELSMVLAGPETRPALLTRGEPIVREKGD